MLLEAILFVVVLILLWKSLPTSKAEKLYKRIPGPKTYPVLGNILEFYFPRKDFASVAKKLSFKYGPVYLLRLGGEKLVCIRDPSDVERVLVSSRVVDKPPLYNLLRPWLKQGLFLSSGETWHRQRKQLTPAFHFKILEAFTPVFDKNAQILVDNLLKQGGKEFDVGPLVSPCALDINCETTMGLTINAQLEESTYQTSVKELTEIIAARSISIMLRTPLFHLLPVGRRHDYLISYVHGVTEDMIRERRKEATKMKENGDLEVDQTEVDLGVRRKRPFLDLLLEYSEISGMSDLEIRMHMDTFLVAGYETVQSSLGFTLYCLSQHQDVQEKAHSEMKEICGDSDREATYQDLQNMKYLEIIIKESMRMYPPAQIMARVTHEDIKLKSDITIPAESSIIVLIEAMNYDPEIYSEPGTFKPDRFINSSSPSSFIPFGAGIRNCIGHKYAMLEMKSVISRVVRQLHLLPSDIPLDLRFDLILKSTSGINLRVEPRS